MQRGDIWDIYNETNALIVTTNGVIRRSGLVMGAGSALQAARFFPQLPKTFSNIIREGHYPLRRDYPEYGFVFDKETHIGALQTKYHYRQMSYISLVETSLASLAKWMRDTLPRRVDMVFPAIGYGGQNRERILPLLLDLPNNVFVWEFKEDKE